MSETWPSADVYTDGSYRRVGKKQNGIKQAIDLGGWGALIITPDEDGNPVENTISGYTRGTTSNRMEMMAAVKALEYFTTPHAIRLTTDSKYLYNGMTHWAHVWKRKGWTTKNGNEVKNIDLWKALLELCSYHAVEGRWVRGHCGNYGNERADKLANQAVNDYLRKLRVNSWHSSVLDTNDLTVAAYLTSNK